MNYDATDTIQLGAFQRSRRKKLSGSSERPVKFARWPAANQKPKSGHGEGFLFNE
jgi:hypothetical protein